MSSANDFYWGEILDNAPSGFTLIALGANALAECIDKSSKVGNDADKVLALINRHDLPYVKRGEQPDGPTVWEFDENYLRLVRHVSKHVVKQLKTMMPMLVEGYIALDVAAEAIASQACSETVDFLVKQPAPVR